jgi:hypothetical protein
MNDKIIIIDNFFNSNDLTNFMHLVDNLSWTFGARSRHDKGFKFWSSDLESESSLINTSLKRIHQEFNFKRNFSTVRVHANGQTYGQEGIFHQDYHIDDCYTLLIYMSDTDGHTQFKIDGQLVNIEPLKNRAVFFNSTVKHRALAPSRKSDELRVSLAFKLQEIQS